jgi:hypothetical protein
MDAPTLIAQAGRLKRFAEALGDSGAPAGIKAQVSEFLRLYAGPKSAFYKAATEIIGMPGHQGRSLAAILDNFIAFVGEVLCLLDNETGMHSCLEPKPSVAGWRRRQEEASPCPREYRHRSGRARSLTSC